MLKISLEKERTILVFHGVGSFQHHIYVPHNRILDICAEIKPDEVHFDDAFASAEDTIIALLEKCFKVKVFVPVAYIGGFLPSNDGFFTPRIMNVPTLRTIMRIGCTLGAHGVLHRDMNALSHVVANQEMVAVKEFLEEEFRCEVEDFAFPQTDAAHVWLRKVAKDLFKNVYGLDAAVAPVQRRIPCSATHARVDGMEVPLGF